jgi:hypothetical protein
MFAKIVTVVQWLSDCVRFGVDRSGEERHTRNSLEHHGIVGGSSCIRAPCKRAVIRNQNAGDGSRTAVSKPADDGIAGISLIVACDFMFGERLGDRNRAVKIICVGGSEARNLAQSLCPGGSVLGVSVDDSANIGESFVQNQMGMKIGLITTKALSRSIPLALPNV